MALADLVSIRASISKDNPAAAYELGRHIIECSQALEQQPLLGFATYKRSVRKLIVSRSVYSIFYRVGLEAVEIIEVFDGRRRQPRTRLRD